MVSSSPLGASYLSHWSNWQWHESLKFGQLTLGKIIKIVATRCQILRLKCTKFNFRPRWGSLQRSPRPAALRGPTSKGRGGDETPPLHAPRQVIFLDTPLVRVICLRISAKKCNIHLMALNATQVGLTIKRYCLGIAKHHDISSPKPSPTCNVCSNRYHAWNINNMAKMRLATTMTMRKTMKQTRSITAAAIIHSFIISWFMSLWRYSSSSVRSLVSSRLVIEANWRSTELMLCPADDDAAAAAADVDGDDVKSR